MSFGYSEHLNYCPALGLVRWTLEDSCEQRAFVEYRFVLDVTTAVHFVVERVVVAWGG